MSNRRGSKIAYQFKVRLKQRRSIWRSIVLRGDQTLDALHEVIFAAFERNDEHLYSFFFPNGSSRRSFSERRAKEYTAPQGFVSVAGFETETRFSAASATLDDLALKVGQTFEYLFDFGDEWWHELEVEMIGPIDAGATYPQIVARRGQSPPQHCEYEE